MHQKKNLKSKINKKKDGKDMGKQLILVVKKTLLPTPKIKDHCLYLISHN